jgi:hypothetical protein
MKIALAAFLAFSLFPLADPDEQPACREGCEEARAAELAACGRESSQRGADACREAAQDRHQECIDRCND